MKTRRDWTKAGRFAAAAAGALALAGVGPATVAQAQPQLLPEPTYRCVLLVTHDLPRAEGHACEAFNGAPQEGPVFGEFRIENLHGQAVRCAGVRPVSGFAQLPDRVEGRFCLPVE